MSLLEGLGALLMIAALAGWSALVLARLVYLLKL